MIFLIYIYFVNFIQSPQVFSENFEYSTQPEHFDVDLMKSLTSENKWPDVVAILMLQSQQSTLYFDALVNLTYGLVLLGRKTEASYLLIDRIKSKTDGQKKTKFLLSRLNAIAESFASDNGFQVFQGGQNYLAEQNYPFARERLLKALHIEPHHPWILTRLGQCLLLEGNVDSAYERLSTAYQFHPFEPYIALWLARSRFLRGEIGESLSVFEMHYESLQLDALATLWYSEALKKAGKIKEAWGLLVNYYEKTSKDINILISILEMNQQLGEKGGNFLNPDKRISMTTELYELQKSDLEKSGVPTFLQNSFRWHPKPDTHRIKNQIRTLLAYLYLNKK